MIWALVALTLLLPSCSETRNLAEGETLYVGIREVAYDRPLPKRDTVVQEGVITAVADAYETVSGLLSGDAKAAKKLQTGSDLTKKQRDSIRVMQERDRETYELAKAEVEGVLAHAPNNSLMGSSYYRFPLPMGLWVYNRYVYRKGGWAKWMQNTFGTTPIYLTTVNPRVRAQVAQNTLRNYGYFRARVSADTVAMRNPRKAKVSYEVLPGELFHLDSIAYLNFPAHSDSLLRATQWQRRLWKGDAFSVKNLDAERTRLTDLFRDHGYYYYQPSYITFRADTLIRPEYVQLQVLPAPIVPPQASRPYYIGRTSIHVYDNQSYELTDSTTRRSITLAHSGEPGKPLLKMRALFRHLRYRRGDLYKQSVMQGVQSDLSDMGIFSQLSMHYVPRDTAFLSDTLDVLITARLDKPYDAEFKGNVGTKSNGLVGPGVSFSMARQNAFREAEKVSLDVYGSYEWQTGAQMQGSSQTINSYSYGVALNLQFPRLTILSLGRKFNRRATTTSNYKISADWLNRSGYFGRVSFGARMGYTYQPRPTIRHELVAFRLDYDMLLNTTEKFDSIVKQNPALYVSMRNQFVPSMQYTLQMTSRAAARNPRSFTLVVKEAGNVTSAIYRALGQDWKATNKHLFGVPFAQYLKLTAEVTEKYKIKSTRTYLVGRLFAGVVVSYGNSTIAPYSDLFPIGGANSIRAFGVRSIGPGSYHPSVSGYSYLDQVGDLKLEANLEYRFPLVGNLSGALFLDAGNVWLMKPDAARPGGSFNRKTFGKEIALGTGFGFRYDLDFLVLRFDVGIGLHAPYDTGKSGYYNMPKFMDSLGYHIAVGYPF